MPRLESTLLDKFVSGAFMGKRKIGRPIKYNLRNKGRQGWIELVFNPRNRFEQAISETLRFVHPYLFFITYRFHVEKAREAGLRVEDMYANKFHKEPYIMQHIYAQYFHPSTVLERVRDVRFYRNPRTIFKGFRVPDWATAKEQNGWEFDAYSRQAWDNAMHDMHSEWTPTQFAGERQEPNVLQWFRLEQWGQGFSSRLFYNEVPQPTWWRYGGHMLNDSENERERDRLLYSFTNADQDQDIIFGIDTTTAEGREAFKKEYDALCELAPEMLKKEDLVFPHEVTPQLTNEPHFRRVWQHYREHIFRVRFAQLAEAGEISEEDAEAFGRWVGMSGHPTFNIYMLARTGKLDHLQNDEGFQATMRVLESMGLGAVEFNDKTAQPVEEQFWEQFDGVYELNETEMRSELPNFITDPSNKAKVEALLAGREQAAIPAEETIKLTA